MREKGKANVVVVVRRGREGCFIWLVNVLSSTSCRTSKMIISLQGAKYNHTNRKRKTYERVMVNHFFTMGDYPCRWRNAFEVFTCDFLYYCCCFRVCAGVWPALASINVCIHFLLFFLLLLFLCLVVYIVFLLNIESEKKEVSFF